MDIAPLNHAAVRACLGRRQSLPTLPTTFSKLMQVARDPNASLVELAEIISCDPILMANVLRVANSSYMGLHEPVEDLSAAILYLGMAEIKRIALSVGSFDVFGRKGISSDFLRNIWVHSLTTGLISQQLAHAAHYEFAEDAYLAGLLHDLGKLFFATFYSEVYAQVRIEVAEGRSDGIELESQIFGFSHLDAAAELCSHWKLPQKVASIASTHHDPSSSSDRLFSLCIAAANVLAHKVIADEPVEHRLPQAQAWLAELSANSSNPGCLGPEELENILQTEAQRAKRFEGVAALT